MEPHEILAVDGEDAAVGADGEAEDGIVFDGLVGLSRFVSGEDIVAPGAASIFARMELLSGGRGVEPAQRVDACGCLPCATASP